jgi:cytochrome c peroxidase
MKRIGLAVVLAALVLGCGNKKSAPEGTGSGGSAAEPPAPRPSQQPQIQMEKLTLPEDAKRAEKIALGHALFFDKRLSGNADRSCYSCHMNEDGNGGHDPIAIGSGDKKLTRHSPVIWNVGYAKALYWDGRAKTLEENVKGAWGGGNMGAAPAGAKPDEMVAPLDKKAAELAAIPGYKKLFDAAYPGTPVKSEQVIGAIAEYMRTLLCNETKFDKFAAGDKAALDDKQQRGLDVFLGKGACIACHAPPHFSNAMSIAGGAYMNTGIGTKDVPEDKVDIGRKKISNDDKDWAAFKIPSLRNVSKSAPYFHDGSVAKLDDAVRLMATGGIPNKNKSTLLENRNLSEPELADLISFLGALECPTMKEPTIP